MDSSDDEYVEELEESVVSKRSNLRSRSRTPGASAEGVGYRWEDEYQRSWDVVQEDSGGSLATTIAGMVEETKRKRIFKETNPVQRGIIRNLVLVLDMSEAMAETDMRPTRLAHVLGVAADFVTEFFAQNPISQIAIVGIRDGLAQMISPLDGNPEVHLRKLTAARKFEGMGLPSIQNALDMARALLFYVPKHCTREVLVVYGALMSNDPGSINRTIEQLISDNIRVRIVGLAAQVAVCQDISRRTNHGDTTAYNVVLNEQHFRQLLMDVTVPLAISQSTARANSVAIRMGFPSRTKHSTVATLCACHMRPSKQGFTCPQCRSKVCTLPMVCPICELTLILSTHLARSYHHLFPLANFKPLEGGEAGSCFGCLFKFEDHHSRFECPNCTQKFCVDCDLFCHETLHNCPGCESLPQSAVGKAD